MTVQVNWAYTPPPNIGGGYGYYLAAQRLKEAAQAAGVVDDPGADIALHFAAPRGFSPNGAPRSVLYTTWETPEMPPYLIDQIGQAAALIVPSRFCYELLSRFYSGPIHICPLGVHPWQFPFKDRNGAEYRKRPFRWLAVSAPTVAKGWDVIDTVWSQVGLGADNCELYLKTTSPQGADPPPGLPLSPQGEGVWRYDNIVFDTRDLDAADLCALYHSAHAFLFPTGAEGWGLTLQEAMSTGLPCVATRYSGHLEFANERNCDLVPWHPARTKTKSGLILTTAYADPQRVADAMRGVMSNYSKALSMGRRASIDAQEFTWTRAGERLKQILGDLGAS